MLLDGTLKIERKIINFMSLKIISSKNYAKKIFDKKFLFTYRFKILSFLTKMLDFWNFYVTKSLKLGGCEVKNYMSVYVKFSKNLIVFPEK